MGRHRTGPAPHRLGLVVLISAPFSSNRRDPGLNHRIAQTVGATHANTRITHGTIRAQSGHVSRDAKNAIGHTRTNPRVGNGAKSPR